MSPSTPTIDEVVRFHFDPMCPWAYEASKWIRAVRDRTQLQVEWRFFSLELVNHEEGKKFPWERPWSYGWSMMRIAALLRREDPDLLDRWYAENGEAFFVRGEEVFTPGGAADVVERIGLPRGLVEDALADESTHDDVRSEHEQLAKVHGGHGVPTLVFEDGQALYGPTIAEAPLGDDALDLWHAVTLWRRFPSLYDLHRPKTRADRKRLAGFLDTYLTTRPWRTVERDVNSLPPGSGVTEPDRAPLIADGDDLVCSLPEYKD